MRKGVTTIEKPANTIAIGHPTRSRPLGHKSVVERGHILSIVLQHVLREGHH